MKNVRIILLFLAASLLTIGCSHVGFQSIPKQTCSSSSTSADTSCAIEGENLAYSFTFQTGNVDILFVDDNSGSMYPQQAQMASAFSGFLQSIGSLNYQIAIVTTDISTSINPVTGQLQPPGPPNGYGAFQDGQFLQFTDTSGNPATDSNGNPLDVLTPSNPNTNTLFEGTIERPETLACENEGFQPLACPSDVARGIYAVNDAIGRNQDSFFRPGAHLAIIVLSDSDECENGVSATNCGSDYVNDEPQTLIQNMESNFPTKSFSVHAIVTTDAQCAAPVKNPNGIETYGIIGSTYMELAEPDSSLTALGNIVPGDVGNICSTNYTAQLQDIGSIVAQNSQNSPIQLACNPQQLSVSTIPASYASTANYNINSQNQLTFSGLPNGVTVTVSYQCPMY